MARTAVDTRKRVRDWTRQTARRARVLPDQASRLASPWQCVVAPPRGKSARRASRDVQSDRDRLCGAGHHGTESRQCRRHAASPNSTNSTLNRSYTKDALLPDTALISFSIIGGHSAAARIDAVTAALQLVSCDRTAGDRRSNKNGNQSGQVGRLRCIERTRLCGLPIESLPHEQWDR